VEGLTDYDEVVNSRVLGWRAPDRFRWLALTLSNGAVWRLFVCPDTEWDGPIGSVHFARLKDAPGPQVPVREPPVSAQSGSPRISPCARVLAALRGRVILKAWTQQLALQRHCEPLLRLLIRAGATQEEKDEYLVRLARLFALPLAVLEIIATFAHEAVVLLIHVEDVQGFQWDFNLVKES
jgi:hypothetical protein